MNIADKLRKVLEIKNNIKAALEEKGIENVGNDFSNYAESIANIKGGGDEPEPEIEILPDEPPVVEIPEIEIPEIEPWVQPEDWIDLKAKIERHSYEEYPYRIALLLQYDKTDTIVLGTTGNTTCKCITVDDGDRGYEYDVEEGNYAITHSWDGYTGTNGYRWVIYHFDTPEANFFNFPTSTVQAIFDGINADLSGKWVGNPSTSSSSFSVGSTKMVSIESINGGSVKNIGFRNSKTIAYISPNIFGNNRPSLGSMFSGCYNLEYSPILDATGVLDLGDLFYECRKLKYVSPIINIDRATDFSRMFYRCSSLSSIPLINTTNGTNFYGMFNECYSLITIPELNTTNGTRFDYMFTDCYSLITIPELNTANGTTFSNMFTDCYSLITIPELNTANGTDFSCMFQNCYSLITIPGLNTTNGTNFYGMFSGCTSLIYIPQLNFPKAGNGGISSLFSGCSNLKTVIGVYAPESYNSQSPFSSCSSLRYVGKLVLGDNNFSRAFGSNYKQLEYIDIDLPKVRELISMFDGCTSLKKVILNAPLCTSSASMFYGCISLKQINITSETFSQCTNFNNMFYNCSSLVTIPELNTTNGTTFSSMFRGCTSLTGIPLIDTTNGTNFSNMFYGCSSLVTIPELNALNGTDFNNMFYNCSSLSSIPELNTTSGTKFNNMFYNCSSLVTIPELNTTNGTDFSNMFSGCTLLSSIPELNTTNGTNFSYMFYNCSSLSSIPELNTTNGTTFNNMFYNCSSLTSIPLINTTNGTNFSYMFSGCTLLTSIPLINTTNGTNFSNMFYECSSLITIPELNFENAKSVYSLFSGCSSLRRVPMIYAPKVTGTERYYFYNCYGLRIFGGLKIPSVTSISNIWGDYNSTSYYVITDLGEWDLSSIKDTTVEFPINYTTISLKIVGRVQYTINKPYTCDTPFIKDFEIESIEKEQSFSQWKSLTKQSLLNILNALVPQEEGVTKTLNLGSDNLAKLSDEEIAIATSKGWTIS